MNDESIRWRAIEPKPSATTRAAAREKGKALTNADVALTYERDQRRGEPEEPPDRRRGRGR